MDEEKSGGVQQANERNKSESVGSLSGAADSCVVYTPEQVAAMPPKELAKKLPEVMKSLRQQRK